MVSVTFYPYETKTIWNGRSIWVRIAPYLHILQWKEIGEISSTQMSYLSTTKTPVRARKKNTHIKVKRKYNFLEQLMNLKCN